MKRLIIVIGLLLSLTGCGSLGEETNSDYNGNIEIHKVNVDGQDTTCVVYNGIDEAGISCDFGSRTLN